MLEMSNSRIKTETVGGMAETRPISDYLAYLIAQADRQIHRRLDEEFRSEGIPVEQWRILKLLAEATGRSMGELAEAALLTHPTLTKTIDRMVSQALVY